ncbi:MAG: TonB-dependent receptor [Paludibacteraceae bacterium]|nr:TonB-dependent receptor [Paludibacteraceae bacterium]
MNNKKTFAESPLRWRRFSNASYAAFVSMHKEVTIGVLSVAMLAAADMKAQSTQPNVEKTVAEEATADYVLEDVEVTATRVPLTESTAPRLVTVMTRAEIQAAAVGSVNDLLEYATGVDVRQRGEMGVQTDVSVRGGTFDQITILLNGVNISSPHTGHLSADFPVSVDQIERIEVIEGPAARVFGTSAFTGAINIITKNEKDSNVSAHVYGGSYGLVGGNASVGLAKGKVRQTVSGSFSRADGDQPNSDFSQAKFFYQGEYNSETFDLDWQTGMSRQEYGANTFYSAAYPNQWEQTTRWITSVKAETKGRVHILPQIYWNRSKDHFQLIRDTHKGENFHRTDVYGVSLSGYVESKLGKTVLGADMRSEGIISTNLGKPMTEDTLVVRGEDGIYYTKRDSRTNVSYFAEHDFLLKKWTISLGAMAYNTSYLNKKMKVYPGIDISFRPSDKWKFTASWNMGLRLPTFTDMYYKSPTNQGNEGLKPEESSAFDLGVRYRSKGVEAKVSGFYHKGKNMIDWVMFTADDIFHSTAFELDNRGFDVSAQLLGREIWGDSTHFRRLSIGYSFINQERHDDVVIYKSNYALEYLKNKFVAQAEFRLVSDLSASIAMRYNDRNGSYIKYDENHVSTGEKVDYEPYMLVDLRLSWTRPKYMVYAEANNLFNKEYYDLGNIPQPGIWVKAGVKMHIPFKK